MDPRIPKDLTPNREAVLRHGLMQVGTRERTGNNDGPVEKYMPAWARGRKRPWCAWAAGWCFNEVFGVYPYDRHLGSVWDLYHAARERDELIHVQDLGAFSLGIQPGDIGLILHETPEVRGPGHAVIFLRVSQDGDFVNCLEGNWRNQFGLTTRSIKDFDGAANPYGRLCGEHSSVAWERGLIDAPPAGGLASTR